METCFIRNALRDPILDGNIAIVIFFCVFYHSDCCLCSNNAVQMQ